ncbi:hypothetical protein F1880_007657 [Penicillium rolfsii]|nr:hypothetical protein F1880_007657 [Penicillium rolfsii]
MRTNFSDASIKLTAQDTWSFFQSKVIKSTDDYGWSKFNIFTRWTSENNQTGILIFDNKAHPFMNFVPKEHLLADPFWVYLYILDSVSELEDRAVWSIRNLIRPIETGQKQSVQKGEASTPDYRRLHDIARHSIHVTETLDVALQTIERILENHRANMNPAHTSLGLTSTFPRSHPESDVSHEIQSSLSFSQSYLSSLRHRSIANEKRLQNEIQLTFQRVARHDALVMIDDSAALKTLAFVTFTFLPPTFICAMFTVCPFSIAFLVFINSSISFVVTDLIGLHDGKGDAVGTLGFADELLALAACPLWGVLSDRIGVRYVCTIGYAVIAVALVLFVQATNVYPQLLLGRLLFSVGGSAVSTMVTAVLPTVTGKALRDQAYRQSVSSELTITPERLNGRQNGHRADDTVSRASPSARLSGFVGLFAGCGALVSLGVFLPLPARFEKLGLSPAQAIQRSYYVVAAVALLISLVSFIGLRNLPEEEGKGWRALCGRHTDDLDEEEEQFRVPKRLPYWKQLTTALLLGFRNRSIGLGYVGGFVARASSVGISLFIPLAVNHYYRASGLCDEDHEPMPHSGLGDIKKACPRAYILASILTGVSQLVALIAAPAFGYLTDKSRRYNVPLLVAALVGVVGYLAFGLLPNPQFQPPDGNAGVFIVMALLGISQIGAIVCSLATLSNGILEVGVDDDTLIKIYTEQDVDHEGVNPGGEGENQPLLARSVNHRLQHLSHLKGSIAGVYSLYGGAGILILTKVGGLLFDVLSSGTPFYIMAAFNGILLVTGLGCGIWNHVAQSKRGVAAFHGGHARRLGSVSCPTRIIEGTLFRAAARAGASSVEHSCIMHPEVLPSEGALHVGQG